MTMRRLTRIWAAQEPARDFADNVMAHIDRERRATARRKRVLHLATATALAAAVALTAHFGSEWWRPRGDVHARVRAELRLAGGARALLEPGAHVAWNGADVTQDRGEATYAVEHGSTLRVHASGATVELDDGRIRVRARQWTAGGSMSGYREPLGALGPVDTTALIAVIDGRAVVSGANGSIVLEQGEVATVAKGSVQRSGDPTEDEDRFDHDTKP